MTMSRVRENFGETQIVISYETEISKNFLLSLPVIGAAMDFAVRYVGSPIRRIDINPSYNKYHSIQKIEIDIYMEDSTTVLRGIPFENW